MHRCFIAFELSPDTCAELERAMRPFRRALRAQKPRFLAASAYHGTLKFLGAVGNDRLAPLYAAVARAVEQAQAIDTSFAGFGALPKRSKAHVMIAVLRDDQGLVHALQRSIEAATVELGFPAETRSFKPHTTLARFSGAVDLRSSLAVGQLPVTPVHLGSVALFESTLAPGGAKYQVLQRWALPGRPTLPEE